MEGINFAIKHIVKEPSPATGDFVRGGAYHYCVSLLQREGLG